MTMTKEVKIGLTGVIALVVLFLGINFLKGMSLFSSQDVYYIQFKNAKGLSKNSTVYADGFNIGRVSNVLYDFSHPGRVLVEISVDDALRIPTGSVAQLDEGMLGGCTLNMQLNPMSDSFFHPGDTLMGSDANGLMESASALLPKAEPVLARLDSLLQALNTLARDSNLQQILCNTQTLTASLNESSRQLNRLLKTDMPKLAQTYTEAGAHIITLADHLNAIDLQATLDGVNRTVDHANGVLQQLQNPEGTVGKLLTDGELYNNLNSTMSSANSLLQDLKAHPKRYVHFSLFGKKDKQ